MARFGVFTEYPSAVTTDDKAAKLAAYSDDDVDSNPKYRYPSAYFDFALFYSLFKYCRKSSTVLVSRVTSETIDRRFEQISVL